MEQFRYMRANFPIYKDNMKTIIEAVEWRAREYPMAEARQVHMGSCRRFEHSQRVVMLWDEGSWGVSSFSPLWEHMGFRNGWYESNVWFLLSRARAERAKIYGLRGLDLQYCYDHPFLDLKHVLVLINNGSFKGYSSILGLDKVDVSRLYKEGRYQEILRYIKKEAEVIEKALRILSKEMPSLQKFFISL